MRVLTRTLLKNLYSRQRLALVLLWLVGMIALWWVGAVYAWVYVVTTGLILSGFLVRESALDIDSLQREGIGNGRMLQAQSRGTRESIRAFSHSLGIVAGLTALEVLPLPRDVIVPCLLFMAVGMMLNSAIDLVTRPYLYITRDGEPEIPHEHPHAGE